MVLDKIAKAAKAVAAAATAAGGVLVAATQNGSGLSAGEVVTLVLAVLGALGVTYVVPNKPQE